ncbi:hypothetical protein SDC9_191965 [bioreactor metagenome]|uniref:Uncharacterized protein n=1 Tax=bioreactor metagenome TaxID=1076179 RepID=A0A645HZQ0_9ZZZZ
MINFRVNMIRSTCQHNNWHIIFICAIYYFITFYSNFFKEISIFIKTCLYSFFNFFMCNIIKCISKNLSHFLREVFRTVDTNIIINKRNLLHFCHICLNNFWIICNHWTIIVIISKMFINVICHTWIENRIQIFLQ